VRGWAFIRELDQLFDEADFWEKWASRLNPEERKGIVQGDSGVIRRPVEPEWPALEWMQLASNFWIKPHRPKFTHKGWRITFDIRDFRVRMPRRVPQMFEPPELDSFGDPIPPTPDAIESARLEGNYTSSAELAVPDVGESVPDDYQNGLVIQAKERFASHREKAQAEELAKRDLRSVTAQIRETAIQMARNGLDPNPWLTDLQRQINARKNDLENAA
jgi:hypothetical protein